MKFASLIVFTVFAVGLQAEPYLFEPDGWALGTEFPAEPKVSEVRTPKPEGDIFQSRAIVEFSSEAFALTRIHKPVPIRKDRLAEAYDGARDGMLRASRATLLSDEKINVVGRDSRRYICTSNNGAMLFEVRMVIIEDELFLFMHIRLQKMSESAAVAAFFDKISEKKSADGRSKND